MQLSPGVEVIWQLAAQEAVAAMMKEVEPEHFFCALLKFTELEDKDVDSLEVPFVVRIMLKMERDKLRLVLAEHKINSQPTRYAVRQALGRGTYQHQDGSIHRSDAARRIFEQAARGVQSQSGIMEAYELLTTLLANPTPVLQQVLGKAVAKQEPPPQEKISSELKQYVQPVTPDGTKPPPSTKEEEQPQEQVLQWALKFGDHTPLLLVVEPRVEAVPMLTRAAQSQETPLTLSRIDLPALRRDAPQAASLAGLLGEFFESPQERQVFLFDLNREPVESTQELLSASLVSLQKAFVPLVLVVADRDYPRLVENSPAAMDLFRVIWLHDLQNVRIPEWV